MTRHRLVATDIVHAIPLAAVAGLGYLFSGLVDWQLLASLLAGPIPGVMAGSLLAKGSSARWLQVSLALMLMGVGVKTLR